LQTLLRFDDRSFRMKGLLDLRIADEKMPEGETEFASRRQE